MKFDRNKLLVARLSQLRGCFWLFTLKFWEVARTYELSFYLKSNAASVAVNIRWWGHSNTTRWLKKFELYAVTGSGDAKTF